MASLSEFFFDPMQKPPALEQADYALQRDDLLTGQALLRKRALRDYQTRQVPDLLARRASRGSFHSGHTVRDVFRAGEDTIDTVGDAGVKTQQSLADILRNQFLSTLGMRF